jgi:predicted GNAT family acetyltransferase
MSNFQIHHQPEESLFYVHLDDGQRAFVKYQRSGTESAKAMVDFYSTFVPDGYRGQSLASELVNFALDWADENDLHINASCWYVAKKMERHQRQATAKS